MNVEKFFDDLDKKHQEENERVILAENKRKQREKENAEFLEMFNSYYSKNLLKEFRELKTKMKEKFNVEYEQSTKLQQINVFSGHLTITSKFDSLTKFVRIVVIGEADRRLVTFYGEAYDSKSQKLKKKSPIFQDTFEKFIELNIEDEIINILKCYFI
jgi:hypothetical protein